MLSWDARNAANAVSGYRIDISKDRGGVWETMATEDDPQHRHHLLYAQYPDRQPDARSYRVFAVNSPRRRPGIQWASLGDNDLFVSKAQTMGPVRSLTGALSVRQ